MRGKARGPDGLGEGAAPPQLNNEGACRRGASGGAGGSWGLVGGGKAEGSESRSRSDWPEGRAGSRPQGLRPSSPLSVGEGAVCWTLASGPSAFSALPWDPAASRPRLFPALPLALGCSQSPAVPRIPEPPAPDRPDS